MRWKDIAAAAAQAEKVALGSDWKLPPDGRAYRWDCPVPEHEGPASDAA
jgi:hypothetical protein